MCPILDGYGVTGIFNSRTRPRVNRVSRNQLADDVLNLAAYLLRCQHYFRHPLAQFTTKRQPVLRPEVAFSKTSFKHRSIQIKGNFTKGTLHLYFKCIMYYAGLLFWTHVYMDFFLSQRPRKSPPAVMSSSRETPCILLFYCNNGYANEPQRYAIGALPVLFQVGF